MSDPSHRPGCVMVTGAAGFIGANLVGHLLTGDPDLRVVSYDALTYAGLRESLQEVAAACADRHQFVRGFIQDAPAVRQVLAEHDVDTIVHLAAESHVDRSISGPGSFVDTNITGTFVLLEEALAAWGSRDDVRFHHVSTDEVFGSLGEQGAFNETTPYDPSSPYSASKAAADHLVMAWHRTYHLPVTLSNCSNNYGPFQFPEKLIPLMICNALAGEALGVYGDGRNVRDWVFVEDHCRALEAVIRRGRIGRSYMVGGGCERANIDTVRLLCDILDDLRPRGDHKSYAEQITFVPDRPGHDLRYAVDASRIREELSWEPQETFESGLRRTVQWYLDHDNWVAQARQRYAGQRLGLGRDDLPADP